MCVRILSILLTLFGFLGINTAYAQVDFRLAYQVNKSNAEFVQFPNDSSFKFVSRSSFFTTSELVHAHAFLSDGRAVIEIEISSSAQEKFNRLAAKNIENQDKGLFNQLIGLGVVLDGKPVSVMQGIYRPISDRKLWCFLIDDRLPAKEQLRRAKDIVKKMKSGKSPY
ncbi:MULTISPECIES: hypothetical protein [unclassified Acinetobacter]|uniref:hypothetical protein n=1 Tax=unclassified Acinetobacter TaxID=196816 RepID=UPI00244AF667|nr:MULTISPECIES: hypothetical protein [unclassified Acinetobacter]MDH0031440.1 hypothetical protein [Acinetobacter sp. GD04021]MDH0887075.1 hypothetical protein [Acinetobacter sp. GD03873]MDH1083636.1 hypothetical protein [Acinetobacter sp. GD03983]MDH2190391.1 hypothetical protein [Acinetobacter sp. GD03645]MDH2204163.1 hypothetical protein [Acinetobacter sp. GD03647]